MLVFLLLSRNWPKLMKEWVKVDGVMERNYGFPTTLDKRLKITTMVVMALAAGTNTDCLSSNLCTSNRNVFS